IELGPIDPGEDLDLRGAAGTNIKARNQRAIDVDKHDLDASRRGDDVGDAIAIDIGDRHANTAPEGRFVGIEIQAQGSGHGIEDLDFRRMAKIGSNGQKVQGLKLEGTDINEAIDSSRVAPLVRVHRDNYV